MPEFGVAAGLATIQIKTLFDEYKKTVFNASELLLTINEKAFSILENDILRATFLLGFGGRLWSLFHKPAGRELLTVNPTIQFANLALRNAWFSGGVEWNIGTIGHIS